MTIETGSFPKAEPLNRVKGYTIKPTDIERAGFEAEGVNLFGYTTFIVSGENGELVALRGKEVPDIMLGADVELVGNTEGYVSSGHKSGDIVRVEGFVEPFKDGKSDNIIKVSDGQHSGFVKPTEIKI